MLKSSQHFGEFARPVADVLPPSQRSGWDGAGLAVPCTVRGQHRRKVVEELLWDRVFGGSGGHHTRRRHNLLAVCEEVVGLRPCEVRQCPLGTYRLSPLADQPKCADSSQAGTDLRPLPSSRMSANGNSGLLLSAKLP